MGDCQNYGPFLGPYYNTGPNLGDPKRDHNFDNPPNRYHRYLEVLYEARRSQTRGSQDLGRTLCGELA